MLTGIYGRRAVAALGAVALGVGAALGLSSTASAEPQDFGNIDTGKTGSLTVHKYLYQDEVKKGDISEAPGEGDFTKPVKDVVFTVYPLLKGGVALDLTVSTNWDDLADLTPGANCTAPAGYTLGEGKAMPATDAAGSSTLKRELGLYQVCETSAPANIVSKAPAFILTVPMPYQKGWVYDVHAYPKNGDTSISKTVEVQKELGLGATLRYPVTNIIPNMGPNAWTGYAIRDVLDTRLTPTGEGIVSVTVDGEELDPTFYDKVLDGQTVTMNFTDDGLAWLNKGPNGQAGKKIVVTFDTTVNSIGDDGIIKNDAQLWTNNPTFDEKVAPPVNSPGVKSNWGNVVVMKVANEEKGPKLSEAVFEVYAADNPYEPDCRKTSPTGDAIVVDGEKQFRSEEGRVVIDGLFVSDSENPSKEAATRCYVLKEVVAPAGYVLPEGKNALFPVAVTIGQTAEVDLTIVNTQQKALGLPMTGAAGELLLIVAGLGVGGIVVGLMLVNRRRSAALRS